MELKRRIGEDLIKLLISLLFVWGGTRSTAPKLQSSNLNNFL